LTSFEFFQISIFLSSIPCQVFGFFIVISSSFFSKFSFSSFSLQNLYIPYIIPKKAAVLIIRRMVSLSYFSLVAFLSFIIYLFLSFLFSGEEKKCLKIGLRNFYMGSHSGTASLELSREFSDLRHFLLKELDLSIV